MRANANANANANRKRVPRSAARVVLFVAGAAAVALATYPSTSPVAATVQQKQQRDWNYRPWDCDEQIRTMRATGADPNAHAVHARYVTDVESVPPFFMALCSQQYDPLRWKIMETGTYYETTLSKIFTDILKDPALKSSGKDVRVMDVGSNQGWFSLLSASMGYPVDAFDANPINALRICESNRLNHWDGDGYQSTSPRFDGVVNVYNYGISDKDGATMPFAIMKANPGAASFVGGAKKDPRTHYQLDVPLISLDEFARQRGWLDPASDTVIPILKVDVEGFEPEVFAGARELLATGRARNVFLELTAWDASSAARSLPLVELLTGSPNLALRAYGYASGPDQDAGDVRGEEARALLKSKCFVANLQCNLWWVSTGPSR